MKKMYDNGWTQPNLEDNRQDTTDLLANGQLAMAIGHGQVVGDAEARGVNVALAPVPSKDGEGVAIGVTDFIVAFNNQDRKAATAAYLDYFYQDELYQPWYEGTGLLPVTTSVIDSAKASAEGNDVAFLDALSVVRFAPVANPQWDALQTALQQNAFKIGTEEPQALLEQLEAQVAAQG